MTLWTAVLTASVICVALKATGYLLPAHWLDAPHGASLDQLVTQLTESCWAVIRATVGTARLDAAGSP